MPRLRVYKTEAIVLKAGALGEADRLLTLYTPYLGKIKALAKGVRRPKSKLGGHLELLSYSTMMLAQGRNLDIVSQSQTLEAFLPLRQDLWRIGCALYAAELVDRFTPERVEDYPLYKLLLDTLRRLAQGRRTEITLRYFEIQLLERLGYRPQLERCLRCSSPLRPIANFFSASAGGVLCPACSPSEPVVRPLSLGALKVMRLLQKEDYAAASRVRLPPQISLELEGLLREYIRYLLEGEVRSLAFLDRLRREGW